MKKKLMALLLAGVMVVSLAACGGSSTNTNTNTNDTPKNTPTTAPAETGETKSTPEPTATPTPVPVEKLSFSESPELEQLVKEGKLPSVENRLPNKDDIYVEQVDATGKNLSIGNYDDTLNLSFGGGSWEIYRLGFDRMIAFNADGTYYANVLKSYEHNADYTVWTFHLREGMKWSDGEDFDADDITFWYYMMHVTNFDTKASWTALKDEVTGNFAVLKKVDKYTVTWTFENPKLESAFITNGDFKWCWAPEHYWHDMIPASMYVQNEYWENTGLSDEQVLANAKAKGLDYSTLKDLGKQAAYYYWNVSGMPTIAAFMLTTKEGNNSRNSSLCILERNPYYWKVDAAGNQLPYFDNLYLNKYGDVSISQLHFRSGDIDILGSVAMEDIASILADVKDCKVYTWAGSSWGSYQVTFNYTINDTKYAELFANSAFRQALSICVDRENVSEVVSNGFLLPGQAAPAEGGFGYDEEWAKKWTEYDVAAAKKLLESCGLVMGKDNYYDFADGTDLSVDFLAYNDNGADTIYPVIQKYFDAAGIKTTLKSLEVSTYDQLIDNNDWVACIGPHTSVGGVSLSADRQEPFVPIAQLCEWYGEYGTYYQTSGERGVKPTGDMAKLVELFEQWKAETDRDKREALELQIYELHKKNLWTIAYLTSAGSYDLVNEKIGNYANNLVSSDLFQYAQIVHYFTLYRAK
ncbi:MAG: hypothetical protein K6B75_00945 [Lachnospiraceae bacterium]|nr:hypothetical protein [Lachnospiraceae bacterium]